jgi:hypothetical protein
MDVMLDIESAGIKHTSVILSVGAVRFDPNDNKIGLVYYEKPSVDKQLELGRTVDDDTLAWWAKQNPNTIEEAFSEEGRVDLKVFLSSFRKFIMNAERIWAKGPTFDIIMLENFIKQLGEPVPWYYGRIRDARTLYDFVENIVENKEAHNPLEDCKVQVATVQAAYRILKK